MNNPPSPGSAPLEILFDWEGPALEGAELLAAGFVKGIRTDADLLARTAPEVADAIASTVLGNGESPTPEHEIVSFLGAWRRRYGAELFAALEKQVLAETDKQHPALPENDVLRRAVDQMFDRA